MNFAGLLEHKMAALETARKAAGCQLEAISALPAATLREFFNLGNSVHA
jgi:hypothetical protein